ncbi:hypothetical protein ACU6TU_15955 [Halomonas sp. LS-001]
MKLEKGYLKWSSFAKRNGELFAYGLVGFLFLWNAVGLLEWIHELLGWEARDYTPGEQRKYRFYAMGFVGMYIVGTVLMLINMWHYRKHPPEDYRD